jgi:hypothetical protein
MPARRILPLALAFACLLMTGCKQQREPAKPIVDLSDTIVVH